MFAAVIGPSRERIQRPAGAGGIVSKRRLKRYKRRLQLEFWSLEDRTPRKGFTQNVSLRGLFICTASPYPAGTRIAIEVSFGQERVKLLGEVRHAAKVDPVLQRIRPSGMGVRLLKTEEMMAELLNLKVTLASALEVMEEAVEGGPAPEQPTSEKPPPEESEAPVFPVSFACSRDLVVSFERDIKHGGLFVAASDPAEADTAIALEFRFDWDPERRLRLPARVIKRFEAAEGSAAGEKVTGMGVAFEDPSAVIEQIRELVAELDRAPG